MRFQRFKISEKHHNVNVSVDIYVIDINDSVNNILIEIVLL